MTPTPIVIRFDAPGPRAEEREPATPRGGAFLDRDGVLNVDHGYVGGADRWEWVSGAKEAVRLLNEAGFAVVVVTNQSGIGRGTITAEEFSDLMHGVQEELAATGAHLDAVYACPHHPADAVGGFRVDCECRKPAAGMIECALADLGLDRDTSLSIGDTERDMIAARTAGIEAFLFAGGDLLGFVSAILGARGTQRT